MKNRHEIDVENLIQKLREEGMEAIVEVYKLYRNDYLKFAEKFGASQEILLSSWHDAVIAFYEIALAGQYRPEKSSLKTFLFTIAKYKVFNQLKKENKAVEFKEIDFPFEVVLPFLEKEDLKEQEIAIKQALSSLGDKCREVIVLTYYHQYTAEAIQHRMNYENVNVVYSHKSRCLKQLKALFDLINAKN